jgi:ankyrin repeat protein
MFCFPDIRSDRRIKCIMLYNKKFGNTCELGICHELPCFTPREYLREIYPREVNIQDMIGNTPLHICVEKGYVETAHLLLFLGADPYLKNTKGESPISILDTLRKNHVLLSRNQKVIKLLLQRSLIVTTIISALSFRVGNRSSLNQLPIELIRSLDVMLFEPATQFTTLSFHENNYLDNKDYEHDSDVAVLALPHWRWH